MDRVGFLGFFNSPREAAEAWMRSLAKTASVRKARAKAEVEFRSREVAANWRDWRGRLGEMIEFDPSRFENHIPPHWQAGLRYAELIIPAYGTAALDEIPRPSDFEKFLRECAWIVAQRTYEAKLQPYDALPLRKIDFAIANFHQVVRTAVAAESGRLGLEAWQRHNARLDLEIVSASTAAGALIRTGDAGGAMDADPVPAETLARDREARLQAFLTANSTTVAAVSEAAAVHKPDMQHWRHEELSEDSVMSRRIESVLAGKTPLKTGEARSVPAA